MNSPDAARKWTTPPEFLAIFPRIRVLELGSYASDKIGTIKSIRDILIQKENLSSTRLVSDFETPLRVTDEGNGAYNLRKSEHWIRRADVRLFVFLGPDAGVMHELDFALSIPGVPSRSIVAYDRNEHVTSLLFGLMDKYSREISEIPFKDIDDLTKQVAGIIAQISAIIYDDVIYRPWSDWEPTTPK